MSLLESFTSQENFDFQISWNLRFSDLEPSSVFLTDNSNDAASGRSVSWSVDSTDLFLENNFVFAHRGHLQALKVCDLKLLCPSQLCGLKDRIIKVGI